MDELTLEADVDAALLERDGHVVLGEDGDDVARRQGEVVLLKALDHCPAQVEGDQVAGEALAVEALDDGVVPVNFAEGAPHGGLAALLVPDLVVVGARLLPVFALVVKVLGLAVVGVGEQGHVLAQPVVLGDQGLAVRDQVAYPQALAPREELGLGDVTAEGHGVLDLG